MPLLSRALPDYSGEFDVGVIDIEAPCDKRKVVDAFLKDKKPAFELETVLFSLYYPAVKGAKSRQPHHPWIPKPLSLTGEGFARFAHCSSFVTNKIFTFALYMLAGSTTIPAHVDVPIHGTSAGAPDKCSAKLPLEEHSPPEFPIIVFSHGMASSRTSYTQWCGELASRGIIVAAIEHRDGSGPGSIILPEKNVMEPLFHINASMLDPVPSIEDFKVMQLAMRQAEVEETVRILRMINSGHGLKVFKSNTRTEGQALEAFKGRFNMNRIVMAGHSYGATLALQALKGAPNEARPFIAGIAFDPGKSSGPLNDDIDVPLVIVHSQSWSAKVSVFQGRPHFSVVKDLAEKVLQERKKCAWFATAVGTTHPSVTDAPLIEPFMLSWTTGSTIDAREGVLQYVKISNQFMHYLANGHRQSILTEAPTYPEYNNKIRDVDPRIATYWQIHVSPPDHSSVSVYSALDKPDLEDD